MNKNRASAGKKAKNSDSNESLDIGLFEMLATAETDLNYDHLSLVESIEKKSGIREFDLKGKRSPILEK